MLASEEISLDFSGSTLMDFDTVIPWPNRGKPTILEHSDFQAAKHGEANSHRRECCEITDHFGYQNLSQGWERVPNRGA